MTEILRFGGEQPDPVKPRVNVGCLMDIPTGIVEFGKYGEAIINGGMSVFEGVVGAGNLGKSTLMHYRLITANERMGDLSTISIYDTELNIQETNILSLVNKYTFNKANGDDWVVNGKWSFTDKTKYLGDAWYDLFTQYTETKQKTKGYEVELPFLTRKNKEGEQHLMKYPYPTFFAIDSLSNLITKEVATIQDKNSIGDSGANTLYMLQNRHRARIINESPTYCAQSGSFLVTVGHVGEKIQIDPYAPKFKPLPGMRDNLKIKGLPPNYTFETLSCWWLMGSAKLHNSSSDKTMMYPLYEEDKTQDNTDLNIINIHQLRSKSGPSENNIQVILSQRDGIQPSLTEFHHLKVHGRFGLPGNDRNYVCALYPEQSLQRTTVRKLLQEDPLLRRAINICSEYLQMKNMWSNYRELFDITPEEIYTNLKEKGYDWNILLNTRGWWTVVGQHKGLNFLSTLDILRMCKGLYHPYWLEEDKVTIKKEFQ